MKTIAFFSGYFLPHTGGIERYEYNLARQLHKNGVRVIIVTTRYEKKLQPIEEIQDAKIYRLPIYPIFSNRYPIIKKNKEYRDLMGKLEKEHIDYCILNTRFQLTSLIGAKFAKKYHIQGCIVEHGTSHFTVYNKILDFFGHIYEHLLTNYIKKYVKNFYGVSKACCNWLKHYQIEAKGVLYNAIDTKEYDLYKNMIHKSNDKIKILYAGRLLKDKGILLLVEAFKELLNRFKNIELVIAGDGPLGETLEEEKNIKLLGKLNHEELMKEYANAEIFVNPSYSEGLPTTVLEAGLMKCAVLATDVGGTSEIIKDKEEGLLCKPEISDIIEKLEILIKDQELRDKLSKNIHMKVKQQFSWDNTAKSILDIIKE